MGGDEDSVGAAKRRRMESCVVDVRNGGGLGSNTDVDTDSIDTDSVPLLSPLGAN